MIDQTTLPEVKMPNRDGFVGDPRPDTASETEEMRMFRSDDVPMRLADPRRSSDPPDEALGSDDAVLQ